MSVHLEKLGGINEEKERTQNFDFIKKDINFKENYKYHYVTNSISDSF